jgi:hypothetical protein
MYVNRDRSGESQIRRNWVCFFNNSRRSTLYYIPFRTYHLRKYNDPRGACHGRPFIHFLLHVGREWVAWVFRGSPVGGATDRSGDLDAVGRYRGTRDRGEKCNVFTYIYIYIYTYTVGIRRVTVTPRHDDRHRHTHDDRHRRDTSHGTIHLLTIGCHGTIHLWTL